VGGRTFAAFEVYRGRPSIAVMAGVADQAILLDQFGFYQTPYLGKRGWVNAWVDAPVPWELLGDLLAKAHLVLSRRPPTRPRRHS
jgi:predicted DNA-binding protein (MmcQ/YjbR family)